jgi:hypothetical protein
MNDALEAQRERRPAMKKISTVAMERIQIFKESQRTIGMDLGDRSSHYCILNEAGEVIWESKLPTTPKGIEARVVGKMIGWMPGRWHGWQESTPPCSVPCAIAVPKRRSI